MSGFRAIAMGLTIGLAGCPAPAYSPPPPPPPLQMPAPSTAPEPPDRSQLPEADGTTTWRLPAVQTWTTDNGITVWHLEQRSAPLISMRMIFPRGSATDPVGKEGLTGLTADMLDEGAGDMSALALGEAFQRLATSYRTSTGVDGITVSLDMLADKLEPSLDLLADVLQRPQLPAAELQRRKGLWVASALSGESNPGTAAGIVLRRALYGTGYLGGPSSGTKTSLKRVTLADVKRHYASVFAPEGVTVVVVGAVDGPTLKEALNDRFGEWKGKPQAKIAEVAPSDHPADAIYLVDFPEATQSTVIAARRTAGVGAPDHYASLVVNRALGGAFSSRLNLNLREDKGYTYGARSGFRRYREAGYHSLSARVKRETTRASIDEMLRELSELATMRPLTADEHREAIDGLIKGFPGRFERLSSTAARLGNDAEVGRPADFLRNWPTRIQAVTLPQARSAAVEMAKPADYALIVAGDIKTFREQLAPLDRPVYTCDPEGNCKR